MTKFFTDNFFNGRSLMPTFFLPIRYSAAKETNKRVKGIICKATRNYGAA